MYGAVVYATKNELIKATLTNLDNPENIVFKYQGMEDVAIVGVAVNVQQKEAFVSLSSGDIVKVRFASLLYF